MCIEPAKVGKALVQMFSYYIRIRVVVMMAVGENGEGAGTIRRLRYGGNPRGNLAFIEVKGVVPPVVAYLKQMDVLPVCEGNAAVGRVLR